MRLLPSVDSDEPQPVQAMPMVLLDLASISGGAATKPKIPLAALRTDGTIRPSFPFDVTAGSVELARAHHASTELAKIVATALENSLPSGVIDHCLSEAVAACHLPLRPVHGHRGSATRALDE